MKNNNRLQITLSLFALLLSTITIASQDGLKQPVLNDNEVLINIDFKVSDQASDADESNAIKKQMLIKYDDWQEVEVNKHFVKYKVSQLQSDEEQQQFMIETQLLDADKESLHTPTLMTVAGITAAIRISGETDNEPSFNLSFKVMVK